jgi:hypothetical protein
MSKRFIHQQVASLQRPSLTAAPRGLLQRKCACGGTLGVDGMCASCRQKHLTGRAPEDLQPKLRVGRAGDKYEREADHMAERVMRMPAPNLQREGMPGASQLEDEEEIQRKPLLQRETMADTPDEEEDELLQPKASSSGQGKAGEPGLQAVHELRQGGERLPEATRRDFEGRFGYDFGRVRLHRGPKAERATRAVNARAYTLGNNIVLGKGQYAPHSSTGKKLLAHELSHTIQQGAAKRASTAKGFNGTPTRRTSPVIQRAMKFELQTFNKIWRNDGVNPPELLGRKFGPLDYLVKGKEGKKGTSEDAVRLESETDGVIEFETEWHRKWPALKKRLEEAVAMTKEMNKAPTRASGRKAFPFNIDHLRKKSTKEERKTGYFRKIAGKENKSEKILGPTEELEVEIVDSSWIAAIQSSESFELPQYESFLREHETSARADVIVDTAQKILDAANSAKLDAAKLENLRAMLQIMVDYIQRGQAVDLKGKPSKFAFRLLSRTNFASMYKSLLSSKEQALFVKSVDKDLILNELGLDRKSPFFKSGYGTGTHQTGPTVYKWLRSIHQRSKDLLSPPAGGSAAMGRFPVKRSGKHKNLVRFETRATERKFKDPSIKALPAATGGFLNIRVQPASNWVAYAKELFEAAAVDRKRTDPDNKLKGAP